MDSDFWNNLQNFGMASMAAGGVPGATTLGALGQGGMAMNQAANQRTQMQNLQQETIQRKLGNSLALRQLNMGNAMLGMQPITMEGIPDLMPQQPTQPSGVSAGQTWSPNPGMTTVKPTTRTEMSTSNANKMVDLYLDSQPTPKTNGMYGYSQGALEVARGLRPPADLQEATQAASLLSVTGMNPNRQKELEGLVAKNQEPQNLKEGAQVYYPLGGGSIAASKNVNGYNDQNVPVVQSYVPTLTKNGNSLGGGGIGNRNAGGGSSNGGGQIRTGFSPEEKKTQDNFFGPEATAYTGAVNAKGKLYTMQQDLDTLNANPDFLSTGGGGTGRIEFAKSINAATNALFGGDFYNPEKVAAGESLFKVTGNLGFDMSKQLGAREPGVITQQAIKLNPGMDNTPQGAQLIKNTILETQQRTIDERAFKTQYYDKNGYHQNKAELEFDKKYPPELYAQRATSLIKPIKVNTPAAAKQLLAGTKVDTPKGIKIIPPEVGISPPVYQDIQPPQALPVELQGADE